MSGRKKRAQKKRATAAKKSQKQTRPRKRVQETENEEEISAPEMPQLDIADNAEIGEDQDAEPTVDDAGSARAAAPTGGRRKKIQERSGVHLTQGEQLSNLVYYIFSQQAKKLPLKRADLIKHVFNGQRKDFEKNLQKLNIELQDTFGMEIIGLETTGKTNCYITYMVKSKFNAYDGEVGATNKINPNDNTKTAIRFLILCIIFMTGRPIDEETIWNVIVQMEFKEHLGKKREELGKFLKSEYVNSMYLKVVEEMKGDHTVVLYDWGIRANREYDKRFFLSYTSQVTGKSEEEFTGPYIFFQRNEEQAQEELKKKKGPKYAEEHDDEDPIEAPATPQEKGGNGSMSDLD